MYISFRGKWRRKIQYVLYISIACHGVVPGKVHHKETTERSARFYSEYLASASAERSTRVLFRPTVYLLWCTVCTCKEHAVYVRASVRLCTWLRTQTDWHSPPGRLLFNRSPHWPAMVSAHYAASHPVTCNEPSTAAQPSRVKSL